MQNKSKIFRRIGRIFGLLWACSVIIFILSIVFATKGFTSTVQTTWFGNSKLFIPLFLGLILLGVISFILVFIFLALELANNKVIKKTRKKIPFIIKFSKFILTFLFLPIVFLYQTVNPLGVIKIIKNTGFKKFNLKSVFIKTFKSLLIIISLVPIWTAGYYVVFVFGSYLLGFSTLATDVIGMSMNPTFKDGERVNFYSYKTPVQKFKQVKRGDIITFTTGNTINEGGSLVSYVKRIVAVSGDEIQIKDGFLYLNGQIAEEPYILKPRSTHGESFLSECKRITVPDGFVVAIGDNRKRSKDSRNIGFISLKDINGIIQYEKQEQYKDRWRDASMDIKQAGLPSLNKDIYYEKINKIREENNLKPLKRNEKLELAAEKRAKFIINNNELGIDSKSSKYSSNKALEDANYYNIISGEIFTSGYFNEDELTNYWLEYDNTKEGILNKDYQDTGIALVVGKVNDCETQIIVQEFGGYVPPSFKQEDINSWESSLNSLRAILPSWENIRTSPNVYQNNKDRAERIIEIIKIRIGRIEKIVTRMKANKWLTNEEIKYTKEDQGLYNEQESLATFLNSQKW